MISSGTISNGHEKGPVAHQNTESKKRDQRDIIIRKSVEVHAVSLDHISQFFIHPKKLIFSKPDNDIESSTDEGLPNISSTSSSTAPIKTTTGFTVSSEMFYNLQEELRTVKNHHLTHGD